MSDKTQDSTNKKKFMRKAGKTLLIKAKDDSTIKPEWFNSLDGLVENGVTQTYKTGAYFLTFNHIDKSLNALKTLRKEHDDELMVKFAHYRVFFTINGLTDETDYNTVKEAHVDFIQNNTNSEVLYYKLYRNQKYLNCGDLTIDTKDALDKLLNTDEHKEFDLGNGQTGVFYRYNRKGNKDEHDEHNEHNSHNSHNEHNSQNEHNSHNSHNEHVESV